MKVLIIYTTNSGSNYFVAEQLEKELGKDLEIEMKKAEDTQPEDLEKADYIIMGSPSWTFAGKEGQPSTPMSKFLHRCEAKIYQDKPFALFGCGDSSYTYLCGAVDVMEDFVKNTKGKLAVESLKIDKFYDDYDKNLETVVDWAKHIKASAQ